MRYKRITGSKCGQILKHTSTLLRTVLYSKKLDPVPAPIRWGRDNEGVARLKYSELMKGEGHDVAVEQCGFFIHPREHWLGASLDGIIRDHCCSSNGILEIKCPYMIQDISPREACDESSFFCTLSDGLVKLQKNPILTITMYSYNLLFVQRSMTGVTFVSTQK